MFAVLAWGCASKGTYVCSQTDQCVRGGVQGVCEPQGFCSFPDPSCPDGRKFDSSAGSGLGNSCVMVDAGVAACGAVGQACCATGSACGGNGFCDSGACQECVTAVAPGRHASCLLKYDHTVWCAGENAFGQLGFGQTGAPQSSWKQVRDSTSAPITDATAIAAGWEYACAVRAGGTVWCWGQNGSGNLGNNSTNGSPAAVQVQKTGGTPLTGIVEIGAGYAHTCGREIAGGVWCWGSNPNGELGDGTIIDKHQAVPVLDAPAGAATAGVVGLAVGGAFNCARKMDNSIWCWGLNGDGELGDGSTTDRHSPVMVGTGTSIGTGVRTMCTVHGDGTVWCSGEAWRNRIGNGAINYDSPAPQSYPMPAQVLVAPGGAALSGVSAVAVGGVACAITQDKGLECWGDDPYGETGTGAGTNVPAKVKTADGMPLTDVDWIVAKFPHACAHRSNGELYCWGRNLEGELGDGTFQNRGFATPLRFTCP